MQWQVDLVDINYMRPRGGPRAVVPAPETVVADELAMEAGALVFTSGGVVTRAIAAGAWSDVRLLTEADA